MTEKRCEACGIPLPKDFKGKRCYKCREGSGLYGIIEAYLNSRKKFKKEAENMAKESKKENIEKEVSKRLDAEVDEMRDITERPDWEEGHEHRDIYRYQAKGLKKRLKS
ncbi:MAG: hypothetical protein QXL94_00930 [Candidatus Parvarchaeum sp.]